MTFLLDTNVVLRYAVRRDPQSKGIRQVLGVLLARGHHLVICPQNLFELWVVLTRPIAVNGLDVSTHEAILVVDALCAGLPLVPDPPDIVPRWLELCTRYDVRGRQAHDARLVGFMLGSGIDRLLTLNTSDFARYTEITALEPGRAM